MSRLLAIAATLAVSAAGLGFDRSVGSYAFSKQYWVTIPREALDKSPSWNDDADNPPLSARKAIKLATQMKDSLVKDSKDFKWVLSTASLEPVGDDKWFWLINFEAQFQGGLLDGHPHFLRLVVLMDGTVIKPQVKNYP
jgi:hypothetical protein